MKNSILLCVILFGLLTLNAQDDRSRQIREENLNRNLLSNEEFFEKAELVIKGRFLKTFDTYDAKGNRKYEDVYRLQTIVVQQVYKGDPNFANDTLYVIRQGGGN
jgi:hypothetical protein